MITALMIALTLVGPCNSNDTSGCWTAGEMVIAGQPDTAIQPPPKAPEIARVYEDGSVLLDNDTAFCLDDSPCDGPGKFTGLDAVAAGLEPAIREEATVSFCDRWAYGPNDTACEGYPVGTDLVETVFDRVLVNAAAFGASDETLMLMMGRADDPTMQSVALFAYSLCDFVQGPDVEGRLAEHMALTVEVAARYDVSPPQWALYNFAMMAGGCPETLEEAFGLTVDYDVTAFRAARLGR